MGRAKSGASARGYADRVRVLVVSNMAPDSAHPGRGSFVRDQVAALAGRGVEAELYEFQPGSGRYPAAIRAIRSRLSDGRFDLVHAHYGLAGWCARLAGARPLMVTFHGTDVRHPVTGHLSRLLVRRLALVAGASRALFDEEDGRPGLPHGARDAVLPCGADLDRFQPLDRAEVRASLGLDADGRYLLFVADPARRVKRFDRAEEVARAAGAELLQGGHLDPAALPRWINAADAVLVPSDNEGFGLVAVEALACDVAVLSTPVGIAPSLLHGLDGCVAEPFDVDRWAAVARRHLDAEDSRVSGRARAAWFGAEPMAERVEIAYEAVLAAG